MHCNNRKCGKSKKDELGKGEPSSINAFLWLLLIKWVCDAESNVLLLRSSSLPLCSVSHERTKRRANPFSLIKSNSGRLMCSNLLSHCTGTVVICWHFIRFVSMKKFGFDRFQMEQSYHVLVKCATFGVLGHIKSRSDRINFNKRHGTWSGLFNWQQCSCRKWLVNHQLGNRLLHANRLIVERILFFHQKKLFDTFVYYQLSAIRFGISKRCSRRHSVLSISIHCKSICENL